MITTDEHAELATLAPAELDAAPLRPAVYLSTIERRELPDILAADLPTVTHTPRPAHVG